jgi:CheY-like chemotaxis protein
MRSAPWAHPGRSQLSPSFSDENEHLIRSPQPADAHRVLVDDEPGIVDVVSMALRFQGFEVAAAANGAEALAAVERFRPQVIVLDVMLPDMEGFEVAERLGAERGQVPIIFLTARDATEDKLRGLTTGGDDYMTKPSASRSSSRASATSCAAREPPRRTRAPFASRTSSSTRTRAR